MNLAPWCFLSQNFQNDAKPFVWQSGYATASPLESRRLAGFPNLIYVLLVLQVLWVL
jgi:hypothetical protein